MAKAIAEGRWPELEEAHPATIVISLQLGRPNAQGRAVIRRLGKKAAARLAETVTALLQTTRLDEAPET